MNIAAFLEAPLLIQIHAGAALSALALGLSLYLVPRGRMPHQALGIGCAALLAITAGTALFIINPSRGHWSLIHGFIPLTAAGLFSVAAGVRRRNWMSHRKSARGLLIGALVIPFAFAVVLPGRLMNTVFFG